jgi:hypothetical protein
MAGEAGLSGQQAEARHRGQAPQQRGQGGQQGVGVEAARAVGLDAVADPPRRREQRRRRQPRPGVEAVEGVPPANRVAEMNADGGVGIPDTSIVIPMVTGYPGPTDRQCNSAPGEGLPPCTGPCTGPE